MKNSILAVMLLITSHSLHAATERRVTSIEMRELRNAAQTDTPRPVALRTPNRKVASTDEMPAHKFLHSRDSHGTPALKETIEGLTNKDLQQLNAEIKKYFGRSRWTWRKESDFARAVQGLGIAYQPTTKIGREDIEELRGIVNEELSTRALASEESTPAATDSVTKQLTFSTDDEDATEMPVPVEESAATTTGPVNVSNLDIGTVRRIATELKTYRSSKKYQRESTFGEAFNALNIPGASQLGTHWYNAPSKKDIDTLETAVAARLNTEAAADEHAEEPAIIEAETPAPASNDANNGEDTPVQANPTGNDEAAPARTADAALDLNVNALLDGASPTATHAERTAALPAPAPAPEKQSGFTGKQYLAAGGIGGMLMAALASPEMRAGKNPVRILISLLPFLTPARVRTLSRAQKLALGRLVTAVIIGGASVGSVGVGAYKMYKQHKAAAAA